MPTHPTETPPGLSADDVRARAARDGPNELPSQRPRTGLRIAADVLREPMFLLLVACGAIYLALGDRGEALTLMVAVLVVVTITIAQERRTERAVAALRDLTSPRARVIRDGVEALVASRELVVGDLVVLGEGDRVPADGVCRSARNLEIDESMLSGESVPVRKQASDEAAPAERPPGGDDHPFVYSGTLVLRGQGQVELTATGARTQIGRIGAALGEAGAGRPRLQVQVDRIVRVVAITGALLCVGVVLAIGLARGAWLAGLLHGLTLAMALVPEEFPVILTVFLALGAWRLSRLRVLTRRLPALETLGSITVLCTDKTGTLTSNQMAIRRLWAGGEAIERAGEGDPPLPEAFHAIGEFAILASQRQPLDPMEIAFHELGARDLAGTEHLHGTWILAREYPLTPDLLALSRAWQPGEAGGPEVVAAKGAPEAIIDLCHLDDAAAAAVVAANAAMADDGLRVLGIARAAHRAGPLPDHPHAFDFAFVGLVGLEDPLRPGVVEAVARCRAAGIRVVMITGDHPRTATAIARKVGLDEPDAVVTGAELSALDDAALAGRLPAIQVFARVLPADKLRLVEALRAAGEVVAMTGDGVNDAPALKAADVGIAMGGRGTDVAREAAALILSDDDFPAIVEAIANGRRIFDNLQKAMTYVIAVHIPIAGIALAPILLGTPLILQPIHVALLEVVIDPACSLAFEAELPEARSMARPPRDPAAPLLGRAPLTVALVQGAIALAATLAAYGLARGPFALDEAGARALTFTTLLTSNLGLILVNRSWSRDVVGSLAARNRIAWAVIAGALALLALALAAPPVAALFGFARPPLGPLAAALALGIAGAGWFELYKLVRGRR